MKKPVLLSALSAAVLVLAIQLIPVDRTNPPVVATPAWDSARTEQLARGACFDCHSNETKWPWYSHVAPVSWFVADHVHEGRRHLDFSEPLHIKTSKVIDQVDEGEMPLWSYTIMHPASRLSPEDQTALAEGLQRTLDATPRVGKSGDD